MQNILFLRSLVRAYTVPTVRAAGKAGGTMMVMTSSARNTVSFT